MSKRRGRKRGRSSPPPVDTRYLAEFAAILEHQRQEQKQAQRKRRRWWIVVASAMATALATGLLSVITDVGTIPGSALKVPEQAGPKLEEAIGPDAIQIVDMHRPVGTAGSVLLPTDPVQRDAAVSHLLDGNPQSGGIDLSDWKDKWDLTPAGEVTWEITLETFRDQRVEITNMTPVLEGGRCNKPLGGSIFFNDSSGVIDKIVLYTTIDDPDPVFMSQEDRNVEPAPFFQEKQIALEKGKRDSILLHVYARESHCKWRIKADYYYAGARHSQVFGRPDGRPFEITAIAPCEEYEHILPDLLEIRSLGFDLMTREEYLGRGGIMCK